MKKYISVMIMAIFILLLSTSVYAENVNNTIDNDNGHSIIKTDTGSYKEDGTGLKNEFEKAQSSTNTTYNIQLDAKKTYDWTEEYELNKGKATNIVIDGKGSTINTINSSFITIAEDYSLTINNVNFKNYLAENYTFEVDHPMFGLEESVVMYFIRNEGKLTLNNVTIDNTNAYYTLDTLETINSQLTLNNVKVLENKQSKLDNTPNLWIASSEVKVNNLTTSDGVNFWIMDSNIEVNNSNVNFSTKYNERFVFDSTITFDNSTLRNVRTQVDGSNININNSTVDAYYFNLQNSTFTVTNTRLMFANPLQPSAIILNDSKASISKSNIINNGAINKSLIYSVNSTLNLKDSNILNNRPKSSLITSFNGTLNLNNNIFANNTVDGVVVDGYLTNSNITSNIFEHSLKGDSYDIYFAKSRVNATGNIFRNYDNNTVIKALNNTYINLNENWWATNNPKLDIITEGVTISNWRILTFLNKTSLNNNNIQTEAGLYKLSNGLNATGNLHSTTVQFMTDSGKFNSNTLNITSFVNNVYNGSSRNFYIKVDNQTQTISNKIEPVLQANNTTVRSNDKIEVNIKTSNDATGNITFSGYGINYTKAITNGSMSFKLNVNIAAGEYTFKIRYNGNSKYQTKEIDYKVIVLNNQTIQPVKTYTINETNITLPSKYDLRDYNQVTPVKDQGSDGNCVAFGSIASVESAILKQTNKSLDLSENNMKNILAKYSPFGLDNEPNNGLNMLTTIGYLTSWTGPVSESEDAYEDGSVFSPVLNPEVHIQDVYIIPNRNNYTDNDLIKQAIMKYGAVYSEVDINLSGFLNYKNNTYIYNNGLNDPSHAVAIVGWDDNFDKYKFKLSYGGHTYIPKNNGAFIIKNSWGNDYGDNGYHYISYEDSVIGGVNTARLSNYVIFFNKTPEYDNIYQYEYIHDTGIATNRTQLWYNNTFISRGDEIITAVGTLVLDNPYNYTLSIYTNNTLQHIQSGQINTVGYRTIPLTRYLPVNKNEKINVILKITSAKGIRITVTDSNDTCNNSLISSDGKTWTHNLDSTWYYSTDNNKIQAAPLKLYTINNPKIFTTTQIDNNKLVIKTNSPVEGPVTYRINNTTIYSNTASNVTLNITGNLNGSVLTSIYNNSIIRVYETQKINLPARVEVSTNKKVVKMGETITLTATKIGTNDSSVVIFKLNGVTIKDSKNNPIKVKFTNNVASLNFTIPDGWRQKTLTVTAVTSINGQRQEENTTFDIVKIGISLKNTTINRNNRTLTVTTQIRDEHNHVVLGQNVFAIKINGVTYKENNKNKYFVSVNATLNASIIIPNSLMNKNFTIELVTGDRFSYLGTRQNYTVKV